MSRRRIFLYIIMGLLVVADVSAENLFHVAVSIEPQRYFVNRIGGSHVKVSVMLPPGANPEVYEPRPQQMAALAQAKVYFSVGVPFEKAWLPRFLASNPKIVVVATDAGIAKRSPKKGYDSKSQAMRDGRTEGSFDPHVWLSPPLVMLQARHIVATLCRLDPRNRSDYENNYARFITDIVQLDARLRALFDNAKRKQFMVYHPAWGYFAEAYGLQQLPVELEGKPPKGRQLKKLIALARYYHIRTVFVQPQFALRNAKIIAGTIGAELVTIDPLAYEWVDNLLDVGKKIRASLIEK